MCIVAKTLADVIVMYVLQVEESLSARATERFSEMVQVPCGSLKAVVNVKFNQASVITLYIQ